MSMQSTNLTHSEIVQCIEKFVSASEDLGWQPTVQGRLVMLHWEQAAKPTPLLVLDQSSQGMNVTFSLENYQKLATASR